MTDSCLINKVVEGGYCVGCGACAAKDGEGFSLRMTEDGSYSAVLPQADLSSVSGVCPFASALNEDDLSKSFIDAHEGGNHDAALGDYWACYAGHVATDAFRQDGSSGGLGTWIACRLLDTGQIDAVIHVRPSERAEDGHPLYAYALSTSVEDIRKGAKSRYYPVAMADVLRRVKSDQRRYLFVGLPCFVKALRLMQREDEDLRRRIPFAMGLVCGHLKTTQFTDYYAYALGARPDDLLGINFRHKIKGNAVNDYGVKLDLRDGKSATGENRFIFGTNWGHGFFKYEACDYCDDVLAETADITIGDAWLPAYQKDWMGTNILVVRNRTLLKLIDDAKAHGVLQLDAITASDAARSQESGLRHRRQGLAYRLRLKDAAGVWRPRKRVEAGEDSAFTPRFKRVQKGRMLLAAKSKQWFLRVHGPASFRFFVFRMTLLVFYYEILSRGFVKALALLVPKRAKSLLKRALRK